MMITTSPARSRSRHSFSSSPRSTPSSSASNHTTMAYGLGRSRMSPNSSISEMSESPGSEQSYDVVPKTEEIEDERMAMDGIQEHASSSSIASNSPPAWSTSLGPRSPHSFSELGILSTSHAADATSIGKRGRGRPKKEKVNTVKQEGKLNIRSKKGCYTCRKRKKKCDERKPECENCEKNNVLCEGYPPREVWTSGRQKAAQSRRSSMIKVELPCLIKGIETELDRLFWDHFHNNVCKVLSLFTEVDNPFRELLLPMAVEHQGLMHSLLCLSGSHLIAKGSIENQEQVEERRSHHLDRALSILRHDEKMLRSISGDSTALIDDPTSASVLILCLETITRGEVNGQYRPHLDAARHLVRTQQSPNAKFQSFLVEFFIYHDVSNSITSERRSVLMMEDFNLPTFMIQPEAGALLGVVDGLFGFISKVRQLRDTIRARRDNDQQPLINYHITADAIVVETSLRQWVCAQEENTSRYFASELYRQATFMYLYRTIRASEPSESLADVVDKGLGILAKLPSDSSTQSILLMPLFLLGVSAFRKYQRPAIVKAFGDLQEYSSLGNIKYAKRIVELVWEMMDAGNPNNWDWETIIKDQGWDFLIT